MFQLSKKVEYSLIAIRHMASEPRGRTVTAKEISDRYQIPYELLAKVMQKLARKGIISSYQGVHGGYTLARDPSAMKVSDVINAIQEKPSVALVQCEAEAAENCIIYTTCTIKNPLVKLQDNINKMISELTIMDMV